MSIPPAENLRPVPPHGLEARLAIRPVATGRRTVVPLPGDDPASARTARRAVSYQLAAWCVPENLADDLVLIVSELATNAVTHSITRPQAQCKRLWVVIGRHPGGLLVAVVDNGTYDPRVLRPRPPNKTACSGRGLRIIAELSDRWGHRAHPQGTCVWAARDWPEAAPPPLPPSPYPPVPRRAV